MRVAESLFETGLAQILGLIGLVASLFIWRASDIEKTVRNVRDAWRNYRAGANLKGRAVRSFLMPISQLFIWFLVSCGCFLLISYLGSFLGFLEMSYELIDNSDTTLIETIRKQANLTRNRIVATGVAIVVLLLIEWFTGLWVEADTSKDTITSACLFMIPVEWRDAPAEMWRQRLRAASSSVDTTTEDWRSNWEAWIKLVGTVRDAQVDTKGDNTHSD